MSVGVCTHWLLNSNSPKTVKTTDLKFERHVPRDSPNMTPNFFEKGRRQGDVTHEYLGVKRL